MTKKISIHHIDIGQGDATIIRITDHDETSVTKQPILTILVDTGYCAKSATTIMNYCDSKKLKILAIDTIIITHWHDDHYGGLEAMLTLLKAKDKGIKPKLILPDNTPNTEVEKYIKTADVIQGSSNFINPLYIDDKKNRVEIIAYSGKKKVELGGKFQNFEQNPKQDDENYYSTVLLVKFCKLTYYTAGDLPGVQEAELANGVLQNTIITALKISHHGSKSSTPAELIQLCKSAVAVIPFGENSFGHIHLETLLRLDNDQTKIEAIVPLGWSDAITKFLPQEFQNNMKATTTACNTRCREGKSPYTSFTKFYDSTRIPEPDKPAPITAKDVLTYIKPFIEYFTPKLVNHCMIKKEIRKLYNIKASLICPQSNQSDYDKLVTDLAQFLGEQTVTGQEIPIETVNLHLDAIVSCAMGNQRIVQESYNAEDPNGPLHRFNEKNTPDDGAESGQGPIDMIINEYNLLKIAWGLKKASIADTIIQNMRPITQRSEQFTATKKEYRIDEGMAAHERCVPIRVKLNMDRPESGTLRNSIYPNQMQAIVSSGSTENPTKKSKGKMGKPKKFKNDDAAFDLDDCDSETDDD